MLQLVERRGCEEVAWVHVMRDQRGRLLECVESVQPPLPLEKKWVLIVSTLFGCPARCRFCDAGLQYRGPVPAATLLDQIEYMVRRRFPTGPVGVEKFKIQFARMGEPAYNRGVLEALETLPQRLQAPGLWVSLSTIAPAQRESFFDRLLEIKRQFYHGRFQLQFSLHTTDMERRAWLVPVPTWNMERMARFGERFLAPGDRKVTLNFALAAGNPLDPQILLRHFDPSQFLIKITPLNPTHAAAATGLQTVVRDDSDQWVAQAVRAAGYEVIVSVGELEENRIGSNCGQFVEAHRRAGQRLAGGYTYDALAAESGLNRARANGS